MGGRCRCGDFRFHHAVIKLGPVYMEFYSVRSLVDRVAQESSDKTTTQQIRRKVDDYMTVNSLDSSR